MDQSEMESGDQSAEVCCSPTCTSTWTVVPTFRPVNFKLFATLKCPDYDNTYTSVQYVASNI